ncbi:uncharacterized protein LOC117175877 [Belonocnema kinseyi]|uniref:uncharacterized protein LOC117175877 n=1 Tax=Belonocnema kinseyi TaxID=2817044 RepID=UPI00143D5B7B|nr:uncharacterized protein LOC117175877 [Belonocnema kinseyi]
MGKENYQLTERDLLPTIIDDNNENRLFDAKKFSPRTYGSEKSTMKESRNTEKRPKMSYRDLITEVFKDNPHESFTRAEIIEHIKNKHPYYRNKTNWQTTLKRKFNRCLNILFFGIDGTDASDDRYVHRYYLPPNYRLIRLSDEEKMNRNFHQLDFLHEVGTVPDPSQYHQVSFNHPGNIVPSGFEGNTFPIDFSSINPPAFMDHQTDDFNNQQHQEFNQRPLMRQPGLLMTSSGTSSNSLSSIPNYPYSQDYQHSQNYSQGPRASYHQDYQSAYFSYGQNAPYQQDFQATQHFSLEANAPYNFQSAQYFPHDPNAPCRADFPSYQHFSNGPNGLYSNDFHSIHDFSRGPNAYHEDFRCPNNLSFIPNSPYCLNFQSAQNFPNGSNLPCEQNFTQAQKKPCFQSSTPLNNYLMTRDVNIQELKNKSVPADALARGEKNPEIQNPPSPLPLMARNANVQSWLENHLSINTIHRIEEEKEGATGFDKNATSLYFYSKEIPILSKENQAINFNQRSGNSPPGLLMISPGTNWKTK